MLAASSDWTLAAWPLEFLLSSPSVLATRPALAVLPATAGTMCSRRAPGGGSPLIVRPRGYSDAWPTTPRVA